MDRPTPPAEQSERASWDRWSERVALHCKDVRDWLAAPRPSSPRAWAMGQCVARWLGYRGHLLVAEGLLIAATSDRHASAASEPRSQPPLILGGGDDDQVAVLIERAAAHQRQAVSWLRRARDPSIGAVRASQRRSMVMRAVEHIAAARRQLTRACELADDNPELRSTFAQYLQQLDAAADSAGDLTRGLDEQALDH